ATPETWSVAPHDASVGSGEHLASPAPERFRALTRRPAQLVEDRLGPGRAIRAPGKPRVLGLPPLVGHRDRQLRAVCPRNAAPVERLDPARAVAEPCRDVDRTDRLPPPPTSPSPRGRLAG